MGDLPGDQNPKAARAGQATKPRTQSEFIARYSGKIANADSMEVTLSYFEESGMTRALAATKPSL